MNCLDTLQQICDILAEDVDSPLCKEIEEHLKECPKCCAEVDSIRKVVYLYRGIEREEVPEAVDRRLWKVLDLPKPED